MKKLILLSLIMTACSSVQSVTCSLEQTAVNYVTSNVIMSLCVCNDSTQVSSWLTSKVPANIQSSLCGSGADKKGGTIGNLVCAPLIGVLADAGCSKIPSCSGSNPSSTAIQSAITLCQSKI